MGGRAGAGCAQREFPELIVMETCTPIRVMLTILLKADKTCDLTLFLISSHALVVVNRMVGVTLIKMRSFFNDKARSSSGLGL